METHPDFLVMISFCGFWMHEEGKKLDLCLVHSVYGKTKTFLENFTFWKNPLLMDAFVNVFLHFHYFLLYDIVLCLYCYFVLSSLQRLRILLICSLMLLEIPDLLDMGFVQNGENLIVCYGYGICSWDFNMMK